jgi:hypothetical protein
MHQGQLCGGKDHGQEEYLRLGLWAPAQMIHYYCAKMEIHVELSLSEF